VSGGWRLFCDISQNFTKSLPIWFLKLVDFTGEKEEKSDEKKGKTPPMGAFSHLPHYVKIYELVKSAYSAYKVIPFDSKIER